MDAGNPWEPAPGAGVGRTGGRHGSTSLPGANALACSPAGDRFVVGSGDSAVRALDVPALAGARTVVSSLWSVQGRSTEELMRALYPNPFERGMGRLEALRHAQLSR